MKLSIDFDGVIHDFKNPIPGRRMGGPILGAKESLIQIKKLGYEIIVFSTWATGNGVGAICNFMNYYELPFDKITNVKQDCDYYIDDKAIEFSNWKEVLPKIKDRV